MKKYILLVFVVIIAAAGYFLLARGQHKLAANAAVSVTDSTGAKVHIPAEPKRIVFLNASNLEIFTSIGGKAVGRPTSTSYPDDIKESIKDIPEVGTIHAPNLEKIMSLKPDLVVGTNVPFHVMLRKPLEMAGVPLYLNMINSYEDVLKSIDDFGRFAGREKEAAAKRAQIEKEYAALTQDVQKGRGPKVLIILARRTASICPPKRALAVIWQSVWAL